MPWKRATIGEVVAALCLVPWALCSVVRLFGLERGAPFVPAIAFTPYVAATAWLPVVIALGLRRWRIAAIATVVAATLAIVVVPRGLGGPQPALADGQALSVMTSNLAYGHADADSVMALVKEHHVDVLSLQELTPDAVRRLDLAGARVYFPYRVLDPRPGARGSGLMSRYPLRQPLRPQRTRLAMPEAHLEVPNVRTITMKAVHPVPPLGNDVTAWQTELRSLPRATPGGPMIMMIGDFNATLDHHELRSLLATGYIDAANTAGIGLIGTYKAGRRFPPPIAIDHVLIDRRAHVTAASIHTVPGSDHRALFATVSLPRHRQH